jgi:hypothetical protein
MIKLENNWKQKSIENLEKDHWGVVPSGATPLITKVYHLRTIQIEKLELKDIRLLIGQGIGLEYLVPVAFENLKQDLYLDSELFEGDLLRQVLRIKEDFWRDNKDLRTQLDNRVAPLSEEEIERIKK